MSRLPRPLVWFQWFGMASCAMCPVCGVRKMHRDDKTTWHREHILRLSLGGPDTFPNLIPICVTCNLGMGKTSTCTFDYMVRIGRMSQEEAQKALQIHRQVCISFDPRCEAHLKSSPDQRCSNLKAGKCEIYCAKHIKAQMEPMDCS